MWSKWTSVRVRGLCFSEKVCENLPYHSKMQTERQYTDRRVSGNHKFMWSIEGNNVPSASVAKTDFLPQDKISLGAEFRLIFCPLYEKCVFTGNHIKEEFACLLLITERYFSSWSMEFNDAVICWDFVTSVLEVWMILEHRRNDTDKGRLNHSEMNVPVSLCPPWTWWNAGTWRGEVWNGYQNLNVLKNLVIHWIKLI
jgi:hypothetical protein